MVIDDFIGRNAHKTIFVYNHTKQLNSKTSDDVNPFVISYYGVGGVGKTYLEEKLRNITKEAEKNINIYYDFDNGCDMRSVLRSLKIQLNNYDFSFKLFELGNLFYALKTGENEDSSKEKDNTRKLDIVSKMRSNSNEINDVLSHIQSATEIFDIDAFVGVVESFPMVKFASSLTSFIVNSANKKIEKIAEEKFKEENILVLNELDKRKKIGAEAIYEYLPTLFVQDIKNNIAANDNKLYISIFLDTYERLVNEGVIMSSVTGGRRTGDEWLKELIEIMPHNNTLWVIAGRNKISWLDDSQCKELEPFNETETREFLINYGINDEELIVKLHNLTDGYPIFLKLCADLYRDLKEKNPDVEPNISEFGQKREDIVKRLFWNMDSITRDMIKYLCILQTWTDEMASYIIPNFSITVYEQAKNLPFIEKLSEDNNSWQFDKTVYNVLYPLCEKIMNNKLQRLADEYFRSKLDVVDTANETYKNLIKKWIKLTMRLIAVENWKNQYEIKISHYVKDLPEIAEEILKLFMNELAAMEKAKIDSNEEHRMESLTCARFAVMLHNIIVHKNRIKEDADILRMAYERFAEANETREEMVKIIEESQDALVVANDNFTELKLSRHRLELIRKLESEKKIYDRDPARVLDAIWAVGNTLAFLEKGRELLKLRREELELSKKFYINHSSEVFKAMNALAGCLSSMGYEEEAYKLEDELLNIYKTENLFVTRDAKCKPVPAMVYLQECYFYAGAAEEGEIAQFHPKLSIPHMEHILDKLKELHLDEDAERWEYGKTSMTGGLHWFKRKMEIQENNNIEISCNKYNYKYYDYEESDLNSDYLKEQIDALLAEDVDNLVGCGAEIIDKMKKFAAQADDDVVLKLYRKIVALSEKVFGENDETIAYIQHLTDLLRDSNLDDEALEYEKQAVEMRKRFYSKGHLFTIEAIEHLITHLTDTNEIAKYRRQVFEYRKFSHGDHHSVTIKAMINYAVSLININRDDEAQKLIEQILHLSEEAYPDKHPLITFENLDYLATQLEELKQNDNAAKARKLIANLKSNDSERIKQIVKFKERLAPELQRLIADCAVKD